MVKNFLSGLLLGISNAIPGVSGGTMAVILNIYDKLLVAISPKKWKEHLDFLVPLFIGVMLGIFALSNLITPLQKTHPIILGFSFMGLIIGSLPIIARHALCSGGKPKLYNILICLFCFFTMIAISTVENDLVEGQTIEQMGGISPKLILLLVITTAIAAIAMIIPGISGSLVLLIFGTYSAIMQAISDLDLMILLPVTLGTFLGLGLGISGIKRAMTYFPQAMYFAILGLVAGSLWPVFPGFTANADGFIGIACMIIFAVLSFFSSHTGNID